MEITVNQQNNLFLDNIFIKLKNGALIQVSLSAHVQDGIKSSIFFVNSDYRCLSTLAQILYKHIRNSHYLHQSNKSRTATQYPTTKDFLAISVHEEDQQTWSKHCTRIKVYWRV